MAANLNYPAAFLERMQRQLGNEFEAFIAQLNEPAPTSVRLNPRKRISKFDNEDLIGWCNHGRYLKERPSFTFDPLFHAGAYYVQEASSMFLEEVWRQINSENAQVKVLDLCASPGGKSTHLLSLMSEDSLLVSNEVVQGRNRVLQQNIMKWGYANCVITQNKTADFATVHNYFDVVLIDAPCSGEGLFRKDKDAINEWSEKNVTACAIRQKEILQHAYACLKPGGFLIYSTCTFETCENDENMNWLQGFGGTICNLQLKDEYKGIYHTDSGYQFYPHKIQGEGFYISVFKKDGELKLSATSNSRQSDNPQDTHIVYHSENKDIPRGSCAEYYLAKPGNFILYPKSDLTFAIPKSIASFFSFFEKHFYIRQAGIFMGIQKGVDFLPSHDLALSNHIRKDLPVVKVDYDDAITYLRCETIKAQAEKTGWCLVQYEGFNLGWIKVLQNRINNYFPKEWRILKQS